MITERITGDSPRRLARIAGTVYLMNLLFFAPGVLVLGRLVVYSNPLATSINITSHADLVRIAFACNLIGTVAYVGVTVLFYELFKIVNRTLSLLAAAFSLVGCAGLAVSGLFYIMPLLVLNYAPYLNAFRPEQVHAMALLFVKLYVECFNITFVFFGCYCLSIGSLILRSNFLPRILGAGMAIVGLGYLTFLWPPLARLLAPYNTVVTGFIGEGSLTFWLLLAGVNAERWHEQAGTARTDGTAGLRKTPQ
jgi:hypothetical protein